MMRKLSNACNGESDAEPAERDSVNCACIHRTLLACLKYNLVKVTCLVLIKCLDLVDLF